MKGDISVQECWRRAMATANMHALKTGVRHRVKRYQPGFFEMYLDGLRPGYSVVPVGGGNVVALFTQRGSMYRRDYGRTA